MFSPMIYMVKSHMSNFVQCQPHLQILVEPQPASDLRALRALRALRLYGPPDVLEHARLGRCGEDF